MLTIWTLILSLISSFWGTTHNYVQEDVSNSYIFTDTNDNFKIAYTLTENENDTNNKLAEQEYALDIWKNSFTDISSIAFGVYSNNSNSDIIDFVKNNKSYILNKFDNNNFSFTTGDYKIIWIQNPNYNKTCNQTILNQKISDLYIENNTIKDNNWNKICWSDDYNILFNKSDDFTFNNNSYKNFTIFNSNILYNVKSDKIWLLYDLKTNTTDFTWAIHKISKYYNYNISSNKITDIKTLIFKYFGVQKNSISAIKGNYNWTVLVKDDNDNDFYISYLQTDTDAKNISDYFTNYTWSLTTENATYSVKKENNITPDILGLNYHFENGVSKDLISFPFTIIWFEYDIFSKNNYSYYYYKDIANGIVYTLLLDANNNVAGCLWFDADYVYTCTYKWLTNFTTNEKNIKFWTKTIKYYEITDNNFTDNIENLSVVDYVPTLEQVDTTDYTKEYEKKVKNDNYFYDSNYNEAKSDLTSANTNTIGYNIVWLWNKTAFFFAKDDNVNLHNYMIYIKNSNQIKNAYTNNNAVNYDDDNFNDGRTVYLNHNLYFVAETNTDFTQPWKLELQIKEKDVLNKIENWQAYYDLKWDGFLSNVNITHWNSLNTTISNFSEWEVWNLYFNVYDNNWNLLQKQIIKVIRKIENSTNSYITATDKEWFLISNWTFAKDLILNNWQKTATFQVWLKEEKQGDITYTYIKDVNIKVSFTDSNWNIKDNFNITRNSFTNNSNKTKEYNNLQNDMFYLNNSSAESDLNISNVNVLNYYDNIFNYNIQSLKTDDDNTLTITVNKTYHFLKEDWTTTTFDTTHNYSVKFAKPNNENKSNLSFYNPLSNNPNITPLFTMAKDTKWDWKTRITFNWTKTNVDNNIIRWNFTYFLSDNIQSKTQAKNIQEFGDGFWNNVWNSNKIKKELYVNNDPHNSPPKHNSPQWTDPYNEITKGIVTWVHDDKNFVYRNEDYTHPSYLWCDYYYACWKHTCHIHKDWTRATYNVNSLNYDWQVFTKDIIAWNNAPDPSTNSVNVSGKFWPNKIWTTKSQITEVDTRLDFNIPARTLKHPWEDKFANNNYYSYGLFWIPWQLPDYISASNFTWFDWNNYKKQKKFSNITADIQKTFLNVNRKLQWKVEGASLGLKFYIPKLWSDWKPTWKWCEADTSDGTPIIKTDRCETNIETLIWMNTDNENKQVYLWQGIVNVKAVITIKFYLTEKHDDTTTNWQTEDQQLLNKGGDYLYNLDFPLITQWNFTLLEGILNKNDNDLANKVKTTEDGTTTGNITTVNKINNLISDIRNINNNNTLTNYYIGLNEKRVYYTYYLEWYLNNYLEEEKRYNGSYCSNVNYTKNVNNQIFTDQGTEKMRLQIPYYYWDNYDNYPSYWKTYDYWNLNWNQQDNYNYNNHIVLQFKLDNQKWKYQQHIGIVWNYISLQGLTYLSNSSITKLWIDTANTVFPYITSNSKWESMFDMLYNGKDKYKVPSIVKYYENNKNYDRFIKVSSVSELQNVLSQNSTGLTVIEYESPNKIFIRKQLKIWWKYVVLFKDWNWNLQDVEISYDVKVGRDLPVWTACPEDSSNTSEACDSDLQKKAVIFVWKDLILANMTRYLQNVVLVFKTINTYYSNNPLIIYWNIITKDFTCLRNVASIFLLNNNWNNTISLQDAYGKNWKTYLQYKSSGCSVVSSNYLRTMFLSEKHWRIQK